MPDSPYGIFSKHCEQGQLAYQVGVNSGRPVFYPRTIAPVTGEQLEWRISTGLGTVYATTACHKAGQTPWNIALIDLDEGFRMMSRVVDVDATQVRIGQRVKVRFDNVAEGQPPLPVFELVGE